MRGGMIEVPMRLVATRLEPVWESVEANKRAAMVKEVFLKKYQFDFGAAEKAQRLEWVQKALKTFRSCKVLRETGVTAVPPVGPVTPLMVAMGRNPGRMETAHKEPFWPEAEIGKLFQKYLNTLRVTRQEVFITNALFGYTSGDRPPTQEEVRETAFWHRLIWESIEIPRVFLLVGWDAVQVFFDYKLPNMMRIWGDIYSAEFRGQKCVFCPILHPGQVRRSPELSYEVKFVLEFIRDNFLRLLQCVHCHRKVLASEPMLLSSKGPVCSLQCQLASDYAKEARATCRVCRNLLVRRNAFRFARFVNTTDGEISEDFFCSEVCWNGFDRSSLKELG